MTSIPSVMFAGVKIRRVSGKPASGRQVRNRRACNVEPLQRRLAGQRRQIAHFGVLDVQALEIDVGQSADVTHRRARSQIVPSRGIVLTTLMSVTCVSNRLS